MLRACQEALRIELTGGLYHVTSRGDRREPICLGVGVGLYDRIDTSAAPEGRRHQGQINPGPWRQVERPSDP